MNVFEKMISVIFREVGVALLLGLVSGLAFIPVIYIIDNPHITITRVIIGLPCIVIGIKFFHIGIRRQ